MAVDNIKKMYEEMYNSKYATLEAQKRKALEEATNRENSTKLQYEELMKGYETNRTNTSNQYKGLYTGLDNQFEEAKGKYYNDRNQVSSQNSKQVKQTRDMMAKNNLLQSGESVDALMRNNTDFNNALGTVATNEANTNKGIEDKRGEYKLSEQGAYQEIDGKISAADREKTQKLNELMAYREGYLSDWDTSVNSMKGEITANAMKDIQAYNEQIRREEVERKRREEDYQRQLEMQRQQQEFQRQQAAAAAASRSSGGGSGGSSSKPTLQDEKAQFLNEFKELNSSNTSQLPGNILRNEKEEIINRYGKTYYNNLENYYWESNRHLYDNRTVYNKPYGYGGLK